MCCYNDGGKSALVLLLGGRLDLGAFPLLSPAHISVDTTSTLVRVTRDVGDGQRCSACRDDLTGALGLNVGTTAWEGSNHARSLAALLSQCWRDNRRSIQRSRFGELFVLRSAHRVVGGLDRGLRLGCTLAVLRTEQAVHVGLELALQRLVLSCSKNDDANEVKMSATMRLGFESEAALDVEFQYSKDCKIW